jgi:aspartate aminotransferase
MRLARRAGLMGESATLKVARRAAELRARGVDVVDFGAGEPDFPSPPEAVRAAVEALEGGFTKYTPSNGIPELREALAERFRARHRAPWSASQVLVSVGGKGALFQLALALFDDGDEVVLPSPYWVSFPAMVRCAGAEPVLVPTHGDDGFRIHAGAILERLGARTRAVLINAPCNPTGGVVSLADLRLLAAACAERGVLLISDETYESFVYDGAPVVSAASLAAEFPDTVVVVGSFSKTYAMTGWRLGYALGPTAAIAGAAVIQSHATSNATSFAQIGALAALRVAESEVAAMIAEYQRRRDLLIPRLDALPGVGCRPPAGSFYAFPDVSGCFREASPGSGSPELPRGSVAFAEHLLETAHVAVVPGIAFGSDDHVRISFACSCETLERGLERLAGVLSYV